MPPLLPATPPAATNPLTLAATIVSPSTTVETIVPVEPISLGAKLSPATPPTKSAPEVVVPTILPVAPPVTATLLIELLFHPAAPPR